VDDAAAPKRKSRAAAFLGGGVGHRAKKIKGQPIRPIKAGDVHYAAPLAEGVRLPTRKMK
jgi:hypothetical protein